MNKNFKKVNTASMIQISLIGLLAIFIFFRSDSENISVEKNIYDYYAESIVTDYDLNLMNQVPIKERWQVTKSGNYPDVHSNGIISFWYPFFIYKNLIGTSIPLKESQKIFLTRSLANSFFAIISLVLLVYLLSVRLDTNPSLFQFTSFFLGTSFFWYAVFQPGNADITSLFLSILIMILFLKIIQENKSSHYFIFGVLLGVGVGLKVDHVFFLILPIYCLIRMYYGDMSYKLIFKKMSLFTLAFLICVLPMIINDTIKFGHVDYGYREVLSFNYYFLWENLFYPSGYLANNPIYVFSFMGLVMHFKMKTQREMLVLGCVPLLVVLTESFGRIHQESYGGRHWTFCMPILFYFYLFFLNEIKKMNLGKKTQLLIMLLLTAAILQSFNKLFSHLADFDNYYYGTSKFADVVFYISELGFKGILRSIFYFPLFEIKVLYFLPILIANLFVAIAIYWFFIVKKREIITMVSCVAIFLISSYSFMTFLNIINNNKNFEEVIQIAKKEKILIGDGPHIHSLYENLSTTEKAISFYQKNNMPDRVAFFKLEKESYLIRAASEIIYDPIHFKKWLERSNEPVISDELKVD